MARKTDQERLQELEEKMEQIKKKKTTTSQQVTSKGT